MSASSNARALGYGTRCVQCPACHSTRMELGGPHAPRYVHGVLRDCRGNPITPIETPKEKP